jgi:hypothetical protein
MRYPSYRLTPQNVLVLFTVIAIAPAIAYDGLSTQLPLSSGETAEGLPAVAQHQYRIAGKVRLLFFWVGSDNVGSARVTWQREGATSNISLLIGSEPQRAPRGVNEWGYIQEHVHGPEADVFGLRTLTDAESLDDAEAKIAQGSGPQLFGAMCSEVTPTQDDAWVTTVRTSSDLSYHRLPRLLDVLSTSTHWERRQVTRPSDAEPGFLTALSRLMLESIPGAHQPLASLAYVYKGRIYDLTLRQRELVAQMRVGPSALHDLIRGAFAIRNRTTGNTTRFVTTYGSRGALAGIPVEAVYQPHWWLKVELALDDGIDVPTDPATDDRLLRQTQHLCDAAENSTHK